MKYYELVTLKNDDEIKEFVKCGWGGNDIELNDKHIELLKQGYSLGYFDGEYTNIISYKMED